jgi:hypothetical protein
METGSPVFLIHLFAKNHGLDARLRGVALVDHEITTGLGTGYSGKKPTN